MAQHHLHSKGARNFAPVVHGMSEDVAECLLAEVRWGCADAQVCPWCGVMRKHYRRQKRRRWRCAECNGEFSVTTHSPLHGHRLTFKQLILAALMFANKVKGSTLLLMSRDIGISPKTCQVLAGKIRESFLKNMDLTPLNGTVHMDGGYFCGKPRKPNRKIKMPADAIAKRFGKKKIQNTAEPWVEAGMTRRNWLRQADKRVVISLCSSAGYGNGSARTLAFVCRSENSVDVRRIAEKLISPGAIVMTDENSAYGVLSGTWEHYPVSHSREFSTSEGVSNNMAETFNSRLRRGEYGAFHGFRPKYLQDYAAEFAWRETNRRLPQRDQVIAILKGLLTKGRSEWWYRYWQGNHRRHELGLDYFHSRLAQIS
ncbi:IS1595 family transposase [Dyella terrae]|uniref:IS1595 family transposase n=1 Tax=Dyella terrae TaxID=522259 RepID=UPI0031B85671|nr:IS1595 family transposase [Dyella terrae]